MNYDNPRLVDQLAAEYVLGTLHGGARRRFLHLLKYRRDFQQCVAAWEQSLGGMVEAVDEVSPPVSVWRGIDDRINKRSKTGSNGLFLWRAWSALATLASVALLVTLLQPQTPILIPAEPATTAHQVNHYMGLVGDNSAPLWVLSADLETGQLSARAVNATAAGLDKAFELWILPHEGNPISAGLLPVNGATVTHTLPAGLVALLKESKGLAISIEPDGGSPTGLPTGAVIQTANIWEL